MKSKSQHNTEVDTMPSQQLLRELADRPIRSAEEAESIRQILREMLPPQNPQDRLSVLHVTLGHYYQGSTDPNLIGGMVAMYINELADYPDWAVRDACIWWVGRENSDRRRKPLPGDLAEVAHRNTALLRVAQMRINAFDGDQNAPET